MRLRVVYNIDSRREQAPRKIKYQLTKNMQRLGNSKYNMICLWCTDEYILFLTEAPPR